MYYRRLWEIENTRSLRVFSYGYLEHSALALKPSGARGTKEYQNKNISVPGSTAVPRMNLVLGTMNK